MKDEIHETIEDIVGDIRAQNQGLPEDSYALSPLVCDLLSLADRIEAAHRREVAELKHWIKSAARWIKCHDIYHTSGGDLIKQAKEILNDNGEFLFKKGDE